MLLGAGLMHALSPAIGESVADVTLTTTVVLALGFLTVVSSALAFLVYFTLLDRRSAVEINLVHYLIPPVAVIGGYVFFEEALPASALAGFVLIAAGFGVLTRRAITTALLR